MKYTAEEVRAHARMLRECRINTETTRDRQQDKLADICDAYADLLEQIKADEGVANKLVVPVAQGEASLGRCKACGRATRAVCDGLDGNGLGCTNAPSIDLAAVRKVIAHLRHFDSPYTRGLADKLEAAIKGGA